MNEFLQQFLIESRELIDQASDGLLSLERSPRNAEQLDAVFRAFHTLKDGAGIVEFPAMERIMHAAGDLLSGARSGNILLSPELVGSSLLTGFFIRSKLAASSGSSHRGLYVTTPRHRKPNNRWASPFTQRG